jgi:hypothetical protein
VPQGLRGRFGRLSNGRPIIATLRSSGDEPRQWRVFEADETCANKLKLLNTFCLKLYKARVYGLSYDLSGALKQNAAFELPPEPVRG